MRIASAVAVRRGVAVLAMTVTLTSACAISQQQELEMGRQYAAQIDAELPIVQDAEANRQIQALGQELARHGSRTGIAYRFRIVDSRVVNAFAVPGGYVYVNRGLIERTANMAELAGVMAHEIAHVELRHSVAQLERAQRANTGLTLAYVLLGRQPTGVEQAALQVGGGLYFSSHSREAEREADQQAVALLVGAGIDPNGLPSFFRKLIQDQNRATPGVAQWFSTHPTTQERVADAQRVIARQPASRMTGLRTDSQGYRALKSALGRLPPPPDNGR